MLKAALIAPNSLPIPPIRGGGIQNVVAETVPFYKEFRPYVFSNLEYGIDSLPLRETDGNVEHRRICLSSWEELRIRLRHFTTHNYFPYVYKIIGQLKQIEPDVIHLMNRPWFLPILRKHLGSRTKIILHHFNNYLMEMPKARAQGYLKLIDGFIGCSDFTVNAEVVSRFPQYKNICHTVSNGIDVGKFDPAAIDQKKLAVLRDRYKIKDKDIVVLYVGRLTEDKGAGELLDSVKELITNLGMKEVKLLIVGSSFFGGSTRVTGFMKRLHRSAEEIKDNIIFTGFINRPEMPAIFALSSLVAVPSIVQDASPTVIYEASAMKKPVIGSLRGGIPEIVLEGKTGLLVKDPKDIDELTEKMLYLIKNPQVGAEMGKAGREFMKKNFTWQTVANRLEQVYLEVLEGK